MSSILIYSLNGISEKSYYNYLREDFDCNKFISFHKRREIIILMYISDWNSYFKPSASYWSADPSNEQCTSDIKGFRNVFFFLGPFNLPFKLQNRHNSL